jgi:DNA-binding winged helix-turn-helix (wHTH) protein/TolB-like protein
MPSTSGQACDFGPYRLDIAEGRLTRNGEVLKVPHKAFELLAALVKQPGHVVSKEELLAEVWGGTFVEEGNLPVHINTLRRLLDDGSGTSYIETVPKRGYRFIGELRTPSPIEAVEVPGAAIAAPAPPSSRRAWIAIALVVLAIAAIAAAYVVNRPAPVAADATLVQSLVVMPFQAIAAPSDHAYLEVGMADAITTRLGGVTKLRVPPMAAVRPKEDPFDAGRRLTVDAVLTGSVQRAGDQLRVTAQLARVADGGLLWAGRFDEPFTDIFGVQDAIAERIATRLLLDLSDSDRAALTRRETKNTEAYDLYLRARTEWARRTPESVRSAIALYEKAISIDPQFALAYAGLADSYNLTHSGIPTAIRFPRAKAAAERAIALDPRSAEAHTSLGFQLYKFEWKWAESQKAFQTAIALNPKYTLAHHWYGELLGMLKKDREAMVEFEKALTLAPDSVPIRVDIAMTLIRARRQAEAIPVLESALAIDPTSGRVMTVLGDAYIANGQESEGLAHRWRGMKLQGVPENQIEELQQAERQDGLRGVRTHLLKQLLTQLTTTGTPSQPGSAIATRLAWAYGELGHRAETLRWLNTAIDGHEDAALDLLTARPFDFLRGSPEFTLILQRVGLGDFK